MIRRQLMKLLFTDKVSHNGAVVRWYYIHLPMFGELYFLKEIKQKMKMFGMTFHVTTSLQNFAVPLDITSLFMLMLDSPDFDKVDLGEYKWNFLQVFNKELAKKFAEIDALDIDTDQKTDLLNKATAGANQIRLMLGDFTKKEIDLCSFATKSGYTPMYRFTAGNATTLFLARPLHDRIAMFKVELMNLKRGPVVTETSSFYFTRELVSKFLDIPDQYKTNYETEADNND